MYSSTGTRRCQDGSINFEGVKTGQKPQQKGEIEASNSWDLSDFVAFDDHLRSSQADLSNMIMQGKRNQPFVNLTGRFYDICPTTGDLTGFEERMEVCYETKIIEFWAPKTVDLQLYMAILKGTISF